MRVSPLYVPCSNISAPSSGKAFILSPKTHLLFPIAVTILSPTSSQAGDSGLKTCLCWTVQRGSSKGWHLCQRGKFRPLLALKGYVYLKMSLFRFSKMQLSLHLHQILLGNLLNLQILALRPRPVSLRSLRVGLRNLQVTQPPKLILKYTRFENH